MVSATATDDSSDSYTCANPSATDTSKLLGLCYYANLPGTTVTNGAHKVSVTFGTTAVTQVQANAAMFYNVATTRHWTAVMAVSGKFDHYDGPRANGDARRSRIGLFLPNRHAIDDERSVYGGIRIHGGSL